MGKISENEKAGSGENTKNVAGWSLHKEITCDSNEQSQQKPEIEMGLLYNKDTASLNCRGQS